MRHKKVLTVLNVSYTQYVNYRHYCFEKWCHIHATKNGLSKRLLVTHEGLFNWYRDQWNVIVENLFYEDNKHYIESDVKDSQSYWDVFKDYPAVIHGYFPGVLLTMIKKEHNTVRYEVN